MKKTDERQSTYSGHLASSRPDLYYTPTTAEDHRAMAHYLLVEAGGGDAANRLAAAQVHATLALTAPEEAGQPHP